MIITTKPTRRAVVAGQAALTVAAALPGAASALTAAGDAASGTSEPATAAAARPPARWTTATAEDLEPYIGQRFRVRTADRGSVVLRLKSVEPARSGPDRPADLPRAEGVSALFESPDQDILVGLGHQTHRVRHARLGSADLFMGPIPTRDGGHLIEVILN